MRLIEREDKAASTLKLFDLTFNRESFAGAVRQVVAAAQQRRKGLVVTPNVDHVVMLQHDQEMRSIFQSALFVYPDGMPLIWLSRLIPDSIAFPERVTGADLLPGVCAQAAETGLRVYFLGGNPGIADMAAENLVRQFPGLEIAGTYCPPFGFERDAAETARIVTDINARNVDLLFVGVGTPKQEKWANSNLESLQVGPILCVGAAFDFAAGSLKRAPLVVQKRGLEWFWRLMHEPRRLWKRYLLKDSQFIRIALREIFRHKKETPSLSILGTRGIPARHGGFETFAEQIALYLVGKGWRVTVYCQQNKGRKWHEEMFQGIRLVHIPVHGSDTVGSIIFDLKSSLHAIRERSLILTLGYNTAIFCFIYRLAGITNLINMDGFEWRRKKWSLLERWWLYLNERFACLVANHLIADHPEIQEHLRTRVNSRKITMIPYGADIVAGADADLLDSFGLKPDSYALVIARPEPENSILEIVKAFSIRERGCKLVLVGAYDPARYPYHAKVIAAVGKEVVILGAVYDKAIVAALRYFCRLYIHGHQVGGTNPSLIEALAAGSPVLAQDNRFNRWVAGSAAAYFKDSDECSVELDRLLSDKQRLSALGEAGLERSLKEFSAERVMSAYESLLYQWLDKA